MALDTTLTIFLQSDPWFVQHPVAQEILVQGNHLISLNKSRSHNIQALLGNMCSYGAARWQYEPGAVTSADQVLTNRSRVTDCKSLADIFVGLVQHLPLVIGNIQARHIERQDYRIVTQPGLITFNGRTGSRLLEGRWCFGDHWVVEIDGLCYDPTFKVFNFSFANPPHIAWYALDEEEDGVFTRSKWTHAHHQTIYMTERGEYTFNRLQARTGKKAAAIRTVRSVFRR
ncbi:hypothetical protein [Granulicella sp. dw_53]|uniref:hypothetical protein n=1 Tax=Granulicella sp. dw_53 TaxID=2719792 RepID=UPI001BD555BF|nr:hypothetical protein [Granulicella sp. dw_53]